MRMKLNAVEFQRDDSQMKKSFQKKQQSYNFKISCQGWTGWEEQRLRNQSKNWFSFELCTNLQKLSLSSPKSKVYLYTLR